MRIAVGGRRTFRRREARGPPDLHQPALATAHHRPLPASPHCPLLSPIGGLPARPPSEVSDARRGRFTFPRCTLDYSGEVRLIANALADAGPLVTETIVLRPGSALEWTL